MLHLMRCISECPASCQEQHEAANITGTKTGASPAPFGGRETALQGTRIDESRKQREDRYQPLGQIHLSRSKFCPKNRSHPSLHASRATPALSTGEWFRRGLRIESAPSTWECTAVQSTYPRVRNRQAISPSRESFVSVVPAIRMSPSHFSEPFCFGKNLASMLG